MGVLNIVTVPHEVLGQTAEEIKNIDDRLVALARAMVDTMYLAPGIGLAANQVGLAVRMVVLDVEYAYAEPHQKRKKPIVMVNPRVSLSEGLVNQEEGCLSVPEFTVEVQRPEAIKLEWVDLDEKSHSVEVNGLFARAVQHEIDHLDGRTILDHASSLKRSLYLRKIKKKARRQV